MNIGIFDSGIGGLTLARRLITIPGVTVTYVADSANIPYGTKSKEHIQHIAATITQFLCDQHVDLIIIACHTASALAGKYVQQQFSHIPIITMDTTVINQAIAATNNQCIGILATSATIKSHYHQQALLAHNPSLSIIEQACPTLASDIECFYNKQEQLIPIVTHYLTPLQQSPIDTLILGCTHYTLVTDIVASLLPHCTIISSDEAITSLITLPIQIKNTLQHKFFVSDNMQLFDQKLQFLLYQWNIRIDYQVSLTPWQHISLASNKVVVETY